MALAKTTIREVPFLWEGTDKTGKKVKGQMLAPGEAFVRQALRRQGINTQKVSKQSMLARSQRISEKDIALFTRQLATLVDAGLPLLPGLLHPDRWLLWLGLLFIASVYFFPTGVVGRLRNPPRKSA